MTTTAFATMTRSEKDNFNKVLHASATQYGLTVGEMADVVPTLVVFLRHLGCMYSRRALGDLRATRSTIEGLGTSIVLVHMESENAATALLRRYGLDSLPHVSNPHAGLYRSFGLAREPKRRLLTPRTAWEALRTLLRGSGMGRITADVRQMPGVFLVYQGEIVSAYRHRTLHDRPDYVMLARFDVPEEAIE